MFAVRRFLGKAISKNEEPRLYRQGVLTIQAALDPSLARPGPDILPNRGFVDADRGSEKSSCPDSTPSSIHPRQLVREFLSEPTTRHALQPLHDLGHRILQRNHHVQMYMIPIQPPTSFNEPIGMKFPHFPGAPSSSTRHPRHEDFPPIPGQPHQMILRLVDDMRLSMELHRRPS